MRRASALLLRFCARPPTLGDAPARQRAGPNQTASAPRRGPPRRMRWVQPAHRPAVPYTAAQSPHRALRLGCAGPGPVPVRAEGPGAGRATWANLKGLCTAVAAAGVRACERARGRVCGRGWLRACACVDACVVRGDVCECTRACAYPRRIRRAGNTWTRNYPLAACDPVVGMRVAAGRRGRPSLRP